MQPPLKQSGVLVRRGRWGSHGSEQPGPNLPGVNARAKKVADGFALLITERTGVVLLEAMPQPSTSGHAKRAKKNIFGYSCTCDSVHAYTNIRGTILLRVSVNLNKEKDKQSN
jgi:hypothetical protein